MGILSLLFGGKPSQDLTAEHAIALEILSRRPEASALDVLRIAHIAQVEHAGRFGSRIVPTPFLASSMGPMNQLVLAKAKRLKTIAKRRPDVLDEHSRLPPEAARTVRTICKLTAHMTSAQLVAHTHRPDGSWSRCFHPCPHSMLSISDPRRHTMKPRDVYAGHVISLAAMIDEYRRFPTSAHAASGAEPQQAA